VRGGFGAVRGGLEPVFNFKRGNGPPAFDEQDLRDVFDGGRRKASRKNLAADLMSRGFAEPTAYRALSKGGKFADFILEEDGLLSWKG